MINVLLNNPNLFIYFFAVTLHKKESKLFKIVESIIISVFRAYPSYKYGLSNYTPISGIIFKPSYIAVMGGIKMRL